MTYTCTTSNNLFVDFDSNDYTLMLSNMLSTEVITNIWVTTFGNLHFYHKMNARVPVKLKVGGFPNCELFVWVINPHYINLKIIRLYWFSKWKKKKKSVLKRMTTELKIIIMQGNHPLFPVKVNPVLVGMFVSELIHQSPLFFFLNCFLWNDRT